MHTECMHLMGHFFCLFFSFSQKLACARLINRKRFPLDFARGPFLRPSEIRQKNNVSASKKNCPFTSTGKKEEAKILGFVSLSFSFFFLSPKLSVFFLPQKYSRVYAKGPGERSVGRQGIPESPPFVFCPNEQPLYDDMI